MASGPLHKTTWLVGFTFCHYVSSPLLPPSRSFSLLATNATLSALPHAQPMATDILLIDPKPIGDKDLQYLGMQTHSISVNLQDREEGYHGGPKTSWCSRAPDLSTTDSMMAVPVRP